MILLALGIAADGQKHVLALREGTTENATVCKALLTDLRERGLDLDIRSGSSGRTPTSHSSSRGCSRAGCTS